MQHPNHRGLAGALFVAVLAATIAAPLPAAAYCAQARGLGCCCKGHKRVASDVSIGCHQPARLDTCISRTCGCHQTPDPQNTPPERTTVQTPTGNVAFLPVDVAQLHGGTEFASAFEAARDGHLAAIPHRILHCCWLI